MPSCPERSLLTFLIRNQGFVIKPVLCILAGMWLMFFPSCSNDLETVKHISARDTLPLESAKNIEAIYSDSGKTVVYIYSKQMDKYLGYNSYTEFPKGIKVLYFDSCMRVKSMLTADYAMVRDQDHMMEAKKNVVIIDKVKDVTINTENIIWDQKKKIVYSNTFVKKTSKDGVMYGDGFDADETFTRYTVRNPKGEINVKENEGN